MLDQTIRQTILTLREAGHGTRAIARALHISRNAVKVVLSDGGATPPPLERSEKAEPHRDEILALYADCKGNFVRVHEELIARIQA